jgi:hypothetical protein
VGSTRSYRCTGFDRGGIRMVNIPETVYSGIEKYVERIRLIICSLFLSGYLVDKVNNHPHLL